MIRARAISICTLAALMLILVASPSPGRADDEPIRLDPPASFGGTIRLPRRDRGTMTVFVVRGLPYDFHEILAEKECKSGQFRIEYPGGDHPATAIILSPRHVPVVRGITRRHNWERRAFNPKPWEMRSIRFAGNRGRPLADARIVSVSTSPHFALQLPPTLLVEEHRTGQNGTALIRSTGDLATFIRAETTQVRTPFRPLHPAELKGAAPVYVRRTGRVLEITAWRERADGALTELFEDSLTVHAKVCEKWEGVINEGGAVGGRWELPPGTEAVKIEAPGLRPWMRVGLDPRDTSDLNLFAVLREGVHRPKSRLTVRTEARDRFVPPLPEHLFGCGGCVAPVLRYGPAFRAEIRREGEEKFEPMLVEKADVPASIERAPGQPDLDIPPCGYEVFRDGEATYEVRVRADLGAARTGAVTLPVLADAEIVVDVSNVGGIRVVAAESRTRASLTISFRLETADGTPVPAEYGDGMFNRPPYYSYFGPVFTDVPNGGILRVDPGEYRVVFREDGEDGAAYTLTVRPDTVRRLDTRFAEQDEGSTPRRIR